MRYLGCMNEANLKAKIQSISKAPGVYLFKDAKEEVLYVGKAKSLKSRVRSYFTKSAALGPAKKRMVSLITDVTTISTDSELEALILEATLIHKHQPPYNVLLRDDKYYLFIKISKEDPPRIYPVRKIARDGSRYFGPYSSAYSVRATLRLLRRIFPFKGEKDTAHDIIFPHTLFARDTTGKHTNAEQVERFLKGNRSNIVRTLEAGIKESVKQLQFERAALFRDQLQAVLRLEGFQKVYLPKKESFDVVSTVQDTLQSAANILQVREGKLIGKQTFLLKHKREDTMRDILRQFLLQYYGVAQDIPKKILIPNHIEDTEVVEQWIASKKTSGSVSIAVPQRGTRRQLLFMGEKNAKEFLQEQGAAQETAKASSLAQSSLLQALAMDPHPPSSFRIETYDISNIQGTLATASMVVFVDGMPEKKEYRKFKIRYEATPENSPNDFAMLEETLLRRLARTDWPTPNLLIIDGGKGQLSAAKKARTASGKNIPIISIAKQEEIIYSSLGEIRLPYDSPALHLIQRMRDEAHRFTINYHRALRSKEQIKSALDDVPGIGPKTKKILIQTFGSVHGIKKATDIALENAIGKKKTRVLREHI